MFIIDPSSNGLTQLSQRERKISQVSKGEHQDQQVVQVPNTSTQNFFIADQPTPVLNEVTAQKSPRKAVFGRKDQKIMFAADSGSNSNFNSNRELDRGSMYFRSFQRHKSIADQPRRQSQVSSFKDMKVEEESILPFDDVAYQEINFNPNVIKFKAKPNRYERKGLKSQRQSRDNGYEDIMIVANQKPTHLKLKSPRTSSTQARNTAKASKADFSCDTSQILDQNPNKNRHLIATKTLLQSRASIEGHDHGIMNITSQNGKFYLDLRPRNMTAEANVERQQKLKAALSPANQEFQVRVKLKRYLEKSLQRQKNQGIHTEYNALKTKEQSFSSLSKLIQNANRQQHEAQISISNQLQQQNQTMAKFLPLHNRLLSIIHRRYSSYQKNNFASSVINQEVHKKRSQRNSINRLEQLIQVQEKAKASILSGGHKINLNAQLADVQESQEANLSSSLQNKNLVVISRKQHHLPKRESSNMSKKGIVEAQMKPKFQHYGQLVQDSALGYNIVLMDDKDCGTPMSFFTVGLESFQSPPVGSNQKQSSSILKQRVGIGSSYISDKSILKPIFTDRHPLKS